ncbi:MAG: hypothetical protein IJU29_06940, partial [Oscillospiraceae bacterium]|nr:hypothetical protein [Oscillospiraceae bacterium]
EYFPHEKRQKSRMGTEKTSKNTLKHPQEAEKFQAPRRDAAEAWTGRPEEKPPFVHPKRLI